MAVTGNLTTVSIGDAELLNEYPTINDYRPSAWTDWSGPLADGAREAARDFRSLTGRDPSRAVAVDDNDWKLFLLQKTMVVIFRKFSSFADELKNYEDGSDTALRRFVYRYDFNDDGALSSTEVEDSEIQTLHGIRLRR